MEIYVLIDEKPQGPYTRELIREYLKSGQLLPTDLAAYSGRSDWKPLSALVQSWISPNTPQSSPAPTSRQKPLVAIIAGTVSAIVAAGVVFWMLHHGSMRQIAGIDERTFPKTLAELNNWYVEPPEGQNAATFYLKGMQAIQVTDADRKSVTLPVLGGGNSPAAGEPLPPQAKASIAAFMQRNEEAWASLQPGAGFEQARYPIDMNLGVDTLLPHLAKVRLVAQVGNLRAMLYADNKQPQGAADAILLSLAVTQSVNDEPTTISQLVRMAAIANDTAGLEFTLNSVALSPADLERLSGAFAKVESQDADGVGFTRSTVAERTFILSIFDLPPDKFQEEIKKIQSFSLEGTPKIAVSQLTKDVKSQRSFLAKTFERAFEIRREPFPRRLKLDDYMVSRADEAKNKEFYLCQMFLAGLGKATGREAKGLAQVRLAQTGIALEQFRQEKGSYPDSLSALVPKFLPAVPVDPFGAKPLQYQKSAEGYELTSPANTPKPLTFKVVKPPKSV